MMEDDIGIDLMEALEAAVMAARKAGQIMWASALERRAATAAQQAPISLPPAEESEGTRRTLSSTQNGSEGVGNSLGSNMSSTAVKGGEGSNREEAATNSPDIDETKIEDMATPNVKEDLLHVETKDGPRDLVTEHDRLCDAAVLVELRRYTERVMREKPHINFAFISEELNPNVELTHALTWIVDPIDGTTSFVHGLPDCCVSIGLTYQKQPILAVVLCPFLASGASLLQYLNSLAPYGVPTVAGNGAAAAVGYSTTTGNASVASSGTRGGSERKTERGGGGSASTPPLSPHPHVASSASPLGDNAETLPSPAQQPQQQQQQVNMRIIPPAPPSPVSSAFSLVRSVSMAAGGPVPSPQGRKEGLLECHGELFTAVKGKGCYCNGVRVSVNPLATPENALVVFNYPYSVPLFPEEAAAAGESSALRQSARVAKYEVAVDAAARIVQKLATLPVPGVRMYGSCVTTLSQLAAGRIDAYAEPAGKVWDVCAGSLLVTEAGGVVTNILGEPFDMSRDTTICAGATRELVDFIADACEVESYGNFWIRSTPAGAS